jgi:hypothetical protein
MRAIRIPRVTDPLAIADPNVATNNPYWEGFYILVTGAAANANVATITISF